jgi:hypothetical protein
MVLIFWLKFQWLQSNGTVSALSMQHAKKRERVALMRDLRG